MVNNNPIQLIVGLGNPGQEYESTRHNAGAWFVHALANRYQETLRLETKFHAHVTKITEDGENCWLMIPTTYMNESGRAVKAMTQFYKISPEHILVAHDELDFPAGVVKVKQGGGHGGHNGLRDIISALGGNTFNRARIGIGHPGDPKRVHDYVLTKPSRSDHDKIDNAIDDLLHVTPDLIKGETQKVMKALHTDGGS